MTQAEQDMLMKVDIASMCNAISARVQKLEDEVRRLRKLSQWHDLRKDPADLPPKAATCYSPNNKYIVADRYGDVFYAEWTGEYWVGNFDVIAWCEIPSFKEN